MTFDKFWNVLKAGDVLTIESHPYKWSDCSGGKCGMNEVKYPYTLTIEVVNHNTSAWVDGKRFISIKDTENFGWSININNFKVFTLVSNRKNRIGNLNL